MGSSINSILDRIVGSKNELLDDLRLHVTHFRITLTRTYTARTRDFHHRLCTRNLNMHVIMTSRISSHFPSRMSNDKCSKPNIVFVQFFRYNRMHADVIYAGAGWSLDGAEAEAGNAAGSLESRSRRWRCFGGFQDRAFPEVWACWHACRSGEWMVYREPVRKGLTEWVV